MNNVIKTISVIAISAAAIFFIQSCDKKKDNQPPVITLTSPTEGTVVANGDELHINGTATDDDQLHEGRFQILPTDGSAALLDTSFSVHGLKEYHFHEHYHLHVTTTTNAVFKVTFIDHDEALTTKEVSVTFEP